VAPASLNGHPETTGLYLVLTWVKAGVVGETVDGVLGLVSRTTHVGVADWHDTDTPGVYERHNSAVVRMNLAVQK